MSVSTSVLLARPVCAVSAMPDRLHHYTCDHGADGIRSTGEIRPHPHPLIDSMPLIWLTSMEQPDRIGLGLTSEILSCDRTRWRVTVRTDGAEPWHVFARRYRVCREVRDELEAGRWPMSWFVALDPIPIDKYAIQLVRAGVFASSGGSDV